MKDRPTAFHVEFTYQHAAYLLIQRYKQWTYIKQRSRSREMAWSVPALLLDSARSENLGSEFKMHAEPPIRFRSDDSTST